MTFFTPWHALLYSGYLAVAVGLVAQIIRRIATGVPWRQALPAGYGWSLAGALIFWFGGLGDMVWHTLFGIEVDVEALFSPTHLLLALGVWLMVGGPLRAAWQRVDNGIARLGQHLPMLLSLTFMISTLTFMTQIAHPMANLWAGGSRPSAYGWLFEEMGVMSFLWDAGVLMGSVLFLMRRWMLPPGALTLIVAVNAIGMGFLLSHGDYPVVPVLVRVVAGVIADGLYALLHPSVQQPHRLRWFAFAVPAVITALYFVALQMTAGIWWTIHLWAGIVVLTGAVGVLCSYLLLPPALPTQGVPE